MALASFMQRQARHQGRSTRPEALKHCRKTIYMMSKKIRDVKTCRREVFCDRRTKSFAEHTVKTVPRYAAPHPSQQAQKQLQTCLEALLELPTSVPEHLPSTFPEREANKIEFPGYVPHSTCQKGYPKGPQEGPLDASKRSRSLQTCHREACWHWETLKS